jgi:hypothetical protein
MNPISKFLLNNCNDKNGVLSISLRQCQAMSEKVASKQPCPTDQLVNGINDRILRQAFHLGIRVLP